MEVRDDLMACSEKKGVICLHGKRADKRRMRKVGGGKKRAKNTKKYEKPAQRIRNELRG